MATDKPTKRLGRGLDALLRGATSRDDVSPRDGSGLRTLKISEIKNNPYQPRKRFQPGELKELEDSIRGNGLLQPVTVRKAAAGFELIAGERRLRAVTHLGWKEIPAIVKDVDDQALLTYAMIENLQRADLNPMEEAEGYQQLLEQFGLTQQAVADLVGKDRTTVANSLRVLNLPNGVRELIRDGKLTLGHAKPLLGLDKPEKMLALAREIVAKGLSVRAVERILKGGTAKKGRSDNQDRGRLGSAPVKTAETAARKRLQTDVEIARTEQGTGSITIRFYSDDDLERIFELMGIKLE